MKHWVVKHRVLKHRVLAWVVGLGVGLGSVMAPAPVHADAVGDKGIATIDATIFRAKTQYLEYDGVIRTPDKPDRTLKLAIHMKSELRLSEFLGPSDVKGTKVLILSPTQMYVYLPAYKKVRRIASHVTDQGFMGMNFTQDDMSITSYAKMYTAAVLKDDGTNVTYTLTAKPSGGAPYPKLEIKIDKAKNLPSEIKYFGDSGAHLKTETRSSYTCEKDICAPAELKMVDHTKGGQSTTLSRKAWKVNHDIADSKFSKRSLEDG